MRDLTLVKKLHEALANYVPGAKTQLLTHWGGDADAVGSSYVLKQLLRDVYMASDVYFAVPEGPSTHTRMLMKALGLSESLDPKPDLFILVDVGSLNQLGDLKQFVVGSNTPVILIDHHIPSEPPSGLVSFSSTNYQAASEIVYDLMDFVGLRVEGRFAEALFLGMYYDTVRLSVADRELASKAGLLLQKINPAEVVGMLEPQMDESERVARLKALKRISAYRLGEWYVATSTVKSFQSAVARVLVNAGAHVALVAGPDDDYTVISLRASPEFQRYSGISLGNDLTKYLKKRFEGDGGGHAAAARVRLKTSVETGLSEAVNGLSTLLGGRAEEIQG